ncbi:hypothetical protein [Stenotrophomonas pavanii]|uniref:hypothetical protein n=1 Tax=Stenotrophomonas pavanii TaxID=487698 RepID=UPI001364DEC3|nr:hypothetical protein [Stenotrophomonas maltophilia]MBN5061338.1 hypothetical protein [Stenotrophomonas maltophilia]MBN5069772.1 hypothetical protein [Stenotrophomonas maltophilia]
MTMVITPEIPRAKDAQDVGFRWVSFTRASPPKVGQFWMRANKWTSVAFAGMKKGAEAPLFNDLQTSVEVCRS